MNQRPLANLNPHRSQVRGFDERARPEALRRTLVEARFEATHGRPIVNITPLVQHRSHPPALIEPANETAGEVAEKSAAKLKRARAAATGLKKRKNAKPGQAETPPTPLGCQWLKADHGWNLWRYWSEKDPLTGEKVRRTRYAGFLSQEAWEIMKEYDYETFISIIGQRLRRYGQR
ncbi:MAG TPA: hypothetical protein VJ302_11795 [Blastocatellia bacterium]|nr:hypothetical protein [Blastocatellia bacterium]